MAKVVFMKAGESIKEVNRIGKLYRNVFKIEKMEANVTHMFFQVQSPNLSSIRVKKSIL